MSRAASTPINGSLRDIIRTIAGIACGLAADAIRARYGVDLNPEQQAALVLAVTGAISGILAGIGKTFRNNVEKVGRMAKFARFFGRFI